MIKSTQTVRGTIVIREATMADIEQYRALRLFSLQESPLAFSADYQTSLNRPLEYWQNRLKQDEDSAQFVAEHEQTLIAMMGIVRGRVPKTKHSAEIYGVFVHPEWRGLRIAESLIESCIAWAKSKDVTIVKLGVNAENTSAVRCYQRCGFTIYGTEPRGTFQNGRYYDGHLMYRLLDNS
jgi:ribosomal protein S18 acetylase RimI-like enzyme